MLPVSWVGSFWLLAAVFLSACGSEYGNRPPGNETKARPALNGGSHPVVYGQVKALRPVIMLQMAEDRGLCTAAVVGTRPLTAITAAHCVRGSRPRYFGKEPEKIVRPLQLPEAVMAVLEKKPEDVAVLIFSQRDSELIAFPAADAFTVRPPDFGWGTEVSVCGYGRTDPMIPSVRRPDLKLRCGNNRLLVENEAFSFPGTGQRNHFKYGGEAMTPKWEDADRVREIHESAQEILADMGKGTHLAIAPFLDPAFHVNTIGGPEPGMDDGGKRSLLSEGDSGGPWFIQNGDTNHLIGISSIVFTRGSRRKPAPIRLALAWRLDDAGVKSMLRRAVDEFGADIQGLDDLAPKH